MKKLFLVGFSLFAMNAWAQNIDFGLKAGLVFNADKGVFTALDGVVEEKGKGSVGYQAGAMVRIKAGGLYVQPELLYTAFKNEFEEGGQKFDVKKSRLDIPVNLGKTFAMGLVQVQTGPVFSLNFQDTIDSDGINFPDADERDEISLGWQIGTGVNIKNINVDLRYEFGLGKNVSKYVVNEFGNFETENRSNMLNLSVGYFF
jgi:hypothetical protein